MTKAGNDYTGGWTRNHSFVIPSEVAREKQLKKWSRSKKVALIKTLNPNWINLAPEILGEYKRCLDFARHDKKAHAMTIGVST